MKSPARIAAMFVIFAFSASAQQKPPDTPPEMSVCPVHARNPSPQDQHHQGVAKGGAEGRGFWQGRPTNNFGFFRVAGPFKAKATNQRTPPNGTKIGQHLGNSVRSLR